MNEQMYLSIARWLISGKGSTPTPPKVEEEEDDLDIWDRHLHNCAARERGGR